MVRVEPPCERAGEEQALIWAKRGQALAGDRRTLARNIAWELMPKCACRGQMGGGMGAEERMVLYIARMRAA